MLLDNPTECAHYTRNGCFQNLGVVMAKGSKERITPPSKKDLSAASKELRKGSGPGGRVMSDQSVAKKQGVKRTKP
jgi:hypothetical protein